MNSTAFIPGYRAGTWQADPARSRIGFAIRQLVFSTARGTLADFDITLTTDENPSGSSVLVSIDLASIDTGNPRRDNHLRTASILDVDRHPAVSYRSTGVRSTDDGWTVDGELTLRAVTKPVPLTVASLEFTPGPDDRVRCTASARISRRDFGIRIPGGAGLIGDAIDITIEVDAARS